MLERGSFSFVLTYDNLMPLSLCLKCGARISSSLVVYTYQTSLPAMSALYAHASYFSVVSSRICRKGHNYIIYMRVAGVMGVISVVLLVFEFGIRCMK